jgi:hypothetical protein
MDFSRVILAWEVLAHHFFDIQHAGIPWPTGCLVQLLISKIGYLFFFTNLDCLQQVFR